MFQASEEGGGVKRRSASDVWAEAMAKAPPAYPSGDVLPPVGVSSSAWEDAWAARAAVAVGSVDTSKAGGR